MTSAVAAPIESLHTPLVKKLTSLEGRKTESGTVVGAVFHAFGSVVCVAALKVTVMHSLCCDSPLVPVQHQGSSQPLMLLVLVALGKLLIDAFRESIL